ncbi:MAG: PQQ-binding-like beta-propeller repeat protein [Phycisphaerales bacterium]|nr:MAG: PQQ-binding-like beta-propeller repeat protein [Phycisphaerales bacterium]
MSKLGVVAFLCVCVLGGGWSRAGDWPSYNHDNHGSGVTTEGLEVPLEQLWVYRSRGRPQPAWPGPAKNDFFHKHYDLRSTVGFDRAFHVVGAGDTLYFGSSADDKVYALDADTGRERWVFFTEGPVRFAPCVAQDRVYVGSDDGRVYCLSAADGSLIWKRNIAGQRRLLPGNGRMISMWPVRTAPVVGGGRVYAAAGLFPSQGAYLVSLRAEDGSTEWKQRINVSPQGYILASAERLYVPTGRTGPVIFSRADGRSQGQVPSAGGAYALLTDDVVVTGPGRGTKELNAADARTRDRIATFGGLRMVVSSGNAYMQSEDKLSAFDRVRYVELARERNEVSRRAAKMAEQLKKLQKGSAEAAELQGQLDKARGQMGRLSKMMDACYLWTIDCDYPDSLIMAGDIILAGGEGRVAAFGSKDGRELWSAAVEGVACGLSVVNGRLYVSTDAGRIHCFRSGAKGGATALIPGTKGSPYPADELTGLYAAAAKHIVKQADLSRGYCLVLDSGLGRLAYELARLTEWKIVGVESDAKKVATARKALDEAGLYGRVVIHEGSCEELGYTKQFADLVVSDVALATGKLPASAREVYGLVRPYGGMVMLAKTKRGGMKRWGASAIPGWKMDKAGGIIWGVASKGRPEGAGEWTHIHADVGNTACSGDELVKGPVSLQWFGRPGPREMIDRHHRNVPPLFKDGRLFVPGDCVIFAVDAYNGTIQWKIDVPNSRRLGVFLDCGSMAVDEELLYAAAEDKCYGFDVKSGQRRRTYAMPQLIEGRSSEWGYVAYSGDILFGSGRREGASYSETSYDADIALWYRNMKVVASEYLFALDKGGGKVLWKYRDGLILNPTLTIGGGKMYFVETSSPKALADELGRMPIKVLFNGGEQRLVALDARTGDIEYKKRIDVSNLEEPVCLNYADGVVLLSGSRLVGDSIVYSYYAFEAGSGRALWEASHDSGLAKDGGHGEYNRHPTIVGETVYAWPYAYTLSTGKKVDGWKFDRRGHGCGGVSASTQCLFWRGGNPWMYDLGAGGATRLTSVTRPGCWINIIPAGGLVLIPEASSGCTCGFALQTSMAFAPGEM